MKIGFLNALTLVFVIAKLLGALSWSWPVVFIPTFVSVFLVLLFLVAALVVAIVGDKV